ncbi:hypothetical protein EYM_01805 [Ignicoccus islandicus DSM 13165]|uniref:DUF2283 domain-containing protein n=1 Tax=Ignicoccus islandicus DSM 13165 TaxID=940295 RepID=A0A0U3E2W0_9CREN|nr:DUF2283 domain-containing protein [Ignicoccus islandicus]ALU12251.1 hypothetical protein EYM_01805 [Ignicoccus islandicus DSM 13165]
MIRDELGRSSKYVIVDLDQKGNIIGIEILDYSKNRDLIEKIFEIANSIR